MDDYLMLGIVSVVGIRGGGYLLVAARRDQAR